MKVSIYDSRHCPEDVLFTSYRGPLPVTPLVHPCRNAPVCPGRVDYVGGECLDCRERYLNARNAR